MVDGLMVDVVDSSRFSSCFVDVGGVAWNHWSSFWRARACHF